MSRLTLVLLIATVPSACSYQEGLQHEQEPAAPEIAMAQLAMLDARQLYYEDASIERGMNIAVGTATCVSAAACFSCYQCHGIRGAGSETAGFPRLTGQSYDYLLKSLDDFASGRRPNPTMEAVATGLSEQQMRDVAAYYAAMTEDPSATAHKRVSIGSAEPDLMATGARIANQGSADGRILSCAHCHGLAGAGRPPVYPYLAGQYAGYLDRQLKLFRAGQRSGTELQIMEELARRMSDEQILAVAQYFSSLPPAAGEPNAGPCGTIVPEIDAARTFDEGTFCDDGELQRLGQ